MSIYNRQGAATGKNVIVISDVKTSGNTTSALIHAEFFDKNGKSINQSVNNLKCVNGVLMMDMKIFLPADKQEQQNTAIAKAEDFYLEYPAGIKIGDKLKDGNLNMEFENNGSKSSIEINITERTVEGKESVTTTAGTWDCYKITSKNKLLSKIAGVGMPINTTVTEWYVPGFGVVKTESSMGKTEITSIK